MGTVYRETYTRSLPADAGIITRKGDRLARWTDRNGKKRTAPVTTGRDGSLRLLISSRTFTAKYRDGDGIVRKESTGCRDETAARQVLAEMERQTVQPTSKQALSERPVLWLLRLSRPDLPIMPRITPIRQAKRASGGLAVGVKYRFAGVAARRSQRSQQ